MTALHERRSSPHAPRGSDLADYMREIREIPLLTPEEERELMTRVRKNGCEESRQRVVCGNLRLAVYLAKRYAHVGVPLQDLVEAANVGLLLAVDRFDPDKGARFATYAQWWVRRSIFRTLTEHGRMIHLPPEAQKAQRACRAAAERILVEQGRPATPEELARDTGLPVELVSPLPITASLGAPAAGGDDAHLEPDLADARVEPVERRSERAEAKRRVDAVLRKLPEAERRIVSRHFGLGGHEALTAREIARDIGATEQRVKRMLEAALARLAMLLDPQGGMTRMAG